MSWLGVLYECLTDIFIITGCPWMSITTPDNMFCTYDSMCLGLECCMNIKFMMFLYTIKAYAGYDPCQYEFKFGIKDKHYTLKFDLGYDGE